MPQENSTFKFFPQLNVEDDMNWASSRASLSASVAERFFTTDSLQDKLVNAIAVKKVLPIKEVLEGFEFVARIRKSVRAHTIADLCCGHGLVGMLMAIFEKDVQTVILVDKSLPPSHSQLFDAIAGVCPWIQDKVEFQTRKLALVEIPEGTSVVSAHACGGLTDDCINIAIASSGNIAVMPCCYPRRNCSAPMAVLNQFGEAYAYDIDRTYRMEKADYNVKWAHIPKSITPMNRILIGKRPSQVLSNG